MVLNVSNFIFTGFIGHDLVMWKFGLFGGIAAKNIAVNGAKSGFLKNAQRSNVSFIMRLKGPFIVVRISTRTLTSTILMVTNECMETFIAEFATATLTFA